jgi:hypothetical protein
MEETIQVAAFNTELEAELAKARLTESGIDSFIAADNLGGTFPMMQMITGGFKVRVRVADEARAQEILAEQYEPIESRPPAALSRFGRSARALASPRAARIRVAVYIVLTLLAVLAVIISTTRGTL